VNTPQRSRKLVVAALCRDGAGRILLTQRRADQPMGLLWEFPGGKVEPGEPPVDALVREISEELGCGARVGRIEEVVFHAYDDFDLYMLVYACTLEGEPRPVEVAQLAWVPPPELTQYQVLPADVALVERLAREAVLSAKP
jgi:8-oxo-dGTP diphosphatase